MFLSLISFSLISLIFIGLVFLGTFLVSFYKFLGEREMSSPFECGFDVKNSSRSPFSLRFFLILMLFLIFDIEMILILQFPLFLSFFKSLSFIGLFIFLVLLYIATIEEWRRGFLNWVYE